jgi:hypothetical protein
MAGGGGMRHGLHAGFGRLPAWAALMMTGMIVPIGAARRLAPLPCMRWAPLPAVGAARGDVH